MSNEERPRILNEMQSKKSELESQIKKMEKYIYENETKYLEGTKSSGNNLRAFFHFKIENSKCCDIIREENKN